MKIAIETVKQMLEREKDKALVAIPEGSSFLEHAPDRFTNHGIMQLFYAMLIELCEYEFGHKEG